MFGNKAEKAAKAAEAQAAAERLIALPAADLAVEIMPVFGPGGASTKMGQRIGTLQIANWLLSSGPRGTGQLKQLLEPVREGVQVLENAGLVLRTNLGEGSSYLQATRLGQTALTEGSVRKHLHQGTGS
jgi:hypothetical protein